MTVKKPTKDQQPYRIETHQFRDNEGKYHLTIWVFFCGELLKEINAMNGVIQ